VLYHSEPNPYSIGGVFNVARYLVRALAKKIRVTYFPRFTPRKAYLVDLLSVYRRFLVDEFEVIHFNVVPRWINGARVVLRFAVSRGTPTLLNLHGIIPIEQEFGYAPRGLNTRMEVLNVVSACRDVDRIIVNSKFMRDSAINYYGIDRDKITVIANGVDLERFSKCEREFSLDGDPAILYLGLLTRIKGPEILVQAIDKIRSELPNVKLHIVGHSDTKDLLDLRRLIWWKELDKYVVFHGEARGSMVPCYYKSADIFVLPSRHEGFGITALEAMASGTPIIASDIGSLREIISDGKDGLLFKSGDAEALSAAICTMYRDPGLREKLSQAALKRVREYDWDKIAERYISLYKSLH
jgi:D-inositol-3-phosphate glycosyltransferase